MKWHNNVVWQPVVLFAMFIFGSGAKTLLLALQFLPETRF